ncbi:hypothetical protein GALL_31360 [mine drainage metagenome]|uniref:Uncharacterized protein n=1 Tax=mine drainage metagenome TaxID=410659 RepID=A0A1J5T8H1_9ZZZZ
MSAGNVRLLPDMGGMTVSMTNQIVLSGTGESLPVMRHVRNEYLAPAKFQRRFLSVISKLSVGFRHHAVQCRDIPNIVAMYGMDRNTQLDRSAQGIDADQVTTVDDRLCPGSLCFYNSLHKGI